MITASGSDNSSGAGAAVLPKLPVITDTKGRLRVTKAQRQDILAALARSGESLPRFAWRIGLKDSTLARWVQASQAKPARRKPAIRLLEAWWNRLPLLRRQTRCWCCSCPVMCG